MSLLDRKRVGLVLRVFSLKPELVEKNVQQVLETLAIANNLRVKGKLVFSRIDVLVSADDRYGDTDCGLTREAIEKALAEDRQEAIDYAIQRDQPHPGGLDTIHVAEVGNGDIFCGMLNYGIAKQVRDRIDYTMILSFQVMKYLTVENVEPMLTALEAGARVAGLALTELAPSILDGRIANTFAIWDNISLLTVGGFDLRAAKPLKDDRLADYVRGWSAEKGEVFYNSAGVEEMFPLIRMIKLFGPCTAPIHPVTGGRWEVSNDPDVQKREQSKLGTKFERQMRWAVAEDVDFSFLRGGVMPEYRQQQ
ncbi:hypothetical protein KW796_02545 [Candidatus Parcubacteria bacterium]|nr:hypothetical protein [Candidatus Parcubacteria bacterium]